MEIFCNKCYCVTNHIIFCEKTETKEIKEHYKMLILDLWEDTKIQVLKCQGCGDFSLRKSNYWCEDRENFTGELVEKNIEILPLRSNPNLRSPKSVKNISDNISKLYIEIFDAYNNNSFLLCATGVRVLIESLCEVVKIKKGDTLTDGKKIKNIFDKVNALFQKGFITELHLNILHSFRELGNTAIHELITPSREELENAINIIAHTIDSIYLLNQNIKK